MQPISIEKTLKTIGLGCACKAFASSARPNRMNSLRAPTEWTETHQPGKLHLAQQRFHPLNFGSGTAGIGQRAGGAISYACNIQFFLFSVGLRTACGTLAFQLGRITTTSFRQCFQSFPHDGKSCTTRGTRGIQTMQARHQHFGQQRHNGANEAHNW